MSQIMIEIGIELLLVLGAGTMMLTAVWVSARLATATRVLRAEALEQPFRSAAVARQPIDADPRACVDGADQAKLA